MNYIQAITELSKIKPINNRAPVAVRPSWDGKKAIIYMSLVKDATPIRVGYDMFEKVYEVNPKSVATVTMEDIVADDYEVFDGSYWTIKRQPK